MSDGAETVVAIDCPLADAPVRGRAALGWLISEAFVSAEPTDCLLGTKKGHAPGPNFMAAISGSHRGSVTVEQLGSLRANGVEVVVGRTVHTSGGNGAELTCPDCRACFEPGQDWGDAAATWYEGDDAVSYGCPHCGSVQLLADWDGPYAWGFGSLAVVFWNWPRLDPGFVVCLAEQVGGRVRLVHLHL